MNYILTLKSLDAILEIILQEIESVDFILKCYRVQEEHFLDKEVAHLTLFIPYLMIIKNNKTI
jgi:hypothetical protein